MHFCTCIKKNMILRYRFSIFHVVFAEVTSQKQIEYIEVDNVKYGFVPSTKKRYGFMRFNPGAKKAYEQSSAEIVSKN